MHSQDEKKKRKNKTSNDNDVYDDDGDDNEGQSVTNRSGKGNREEKKVSTANSTLYVATWHIQRNAILFFFLHFLRKKNLCNILRKRKTILRKENRYHVRLLVLVNAFCMKNTHTLHSPNIVSAMQTKHTNTNQPKRSGLMHAENFLRK